MRSIAISFFIAIAVFSAAQANEPQSFFKPGCTRFAIPDSVEHKSVMSVAYGSQRYEVKITQSGSLIREDTVRSGQESTALADMKTNLSYCYSRLPDGGYKELSIIGPSDSNSTYTIAKTDEIGERLGEKCAVWNVAYGTSGIVEKNCLTHDGIILWQKVLSGSGSILHSAEVTSIDRSSVRPEELRVPAEILHLSTWGNWSNGAEQAPNDEVLLESELNPKDSPRISLLIQRFGGYRKIERKEASYHIVSYRGEGVEISVTRALDGSLKRAIVRHNNQPLDAKGIPMRPEKHRFILEKFCNEFNMAAGVSDYYQTDCRTPSGVVLRTESHSWGTNRRLVAKHISEDKLTLMEVVPPVDILQTVH